MTKHIYVFIIAIFFLTAPALYPQKEIKGGDKKAAAIADSMKMKIGKDTSAQKTPAVKPRISVKSKSILSYNAEGYIMNKNELYGYDYRSAGDLLYHIPYGFEQYLGIGGHPHESMLYGGSSGSVSFNEDGLLINSRLTNSFDLTNLQTEKSDSIEIYSLPKAFLFSRLSDNSAINFISKDRVKEKQYSRLRFYQGPNREGFVDFIFSMPLSKSLFFTTEVTNNNTTESYLNSEAGGWRASAKMRYNLSDKVSLVTGYSYVNTETKLNGGVNIEELKLLFPNNWGTKLYEEKSSPVNFEHRGEKVTNHALSVRMLAELIDKSPTDLSLFYRTETNRFRQFDTVDTRIDILPASFITIRDNNKYYSYGAMLKQGLSLNYFDLRFILNWEKSRIDSPLLTSERTDDLFSVSAISTFHLIDSTVHPSFYIKQMNYNSRNYFGAGADLNIAVQKNLFLYAGYSSYKKPYNIFEEEGLSKHGAVPEQQITNYETGIRYIARDYDIRAGYFNTKNDNAAIAGIPVELLHLNTSAEYYFTNARTVSGFNAKFKYKTWKVLLTGNASAYTNYNPELINSPQFTFDGGIFYVDSLFRNNLDLKAGFNFKYYSAQNYIYYDFEKSVSVQKLLSSNSTGVPAPAKTSDVFRVDFFLAGRVQGLAIVYFTFENLFNTRYFIVPHYPAPGRNIRVGVSWEFLD